MNYFNYTFFEILKYKIEFSSCLEYASESYELKKEELTKNISYLRNSFEGGMYKEIISPLFTNYEIVNKNLIDFFNKYNPRKIIKLTKAKKATIRIDYVKSIIDCNQTLDHIVQSFINEDDLKNKLDNKLLKLVQTHRQHFSYFLYFVIYNMYICSLYSNKTEVKYKDKDIKEIVGLLKYCNSDNLFTESIEILEKNVELEINNEFERLSNKCIELENKLDREAKEVISFLNAELEKSKNS